jgi:hypothetical protein
VIASHRPSASKASPTTPHQDSTAPEGSMKRYPLIAIAMIAALAACSTPNSSVPTDVTPTTETITTPTTVPTGEITLEQLGKMTPEQIEKLSPEQLAGVGKLVDADVASVEAGLKLPEVASGNLSAQAASNCGSYTYPAWPNAELTRKCALNINYKQYVEKVRFWYNGPDWSSDGCSSVPDYVFLDPCRHHDFAYRNMPKYNQFRTALFRKQADDRFYSNMKSRCEERYSWWDPRRSYCKGVAYTYYKGVRLLGANSYYGTLVLYP